jgi:hypothetical protein
MAFQRFPIEILLVTRDFLFDPDVFVDSNDEVGTFSQIESQWSWRNFLSVSRNEVWVEFRKHCMIWWLNRFASERFIKERSFQEDVLSRLIDPAVQLRISYNGKESDDNQGFNIQSSPTVEALSFHRLLALSLSSCRSVSISAPHLQVLKLYDCRDIYFLGEMKRLTTVSIQDSGYNDILPLLPLENLKRLIFRGFIAKFLDCLYRLGNLEDLLFYGTGFEFGAEACLPVLPFPRLMKLKVIDLNAINVSGLSNLVSLHVTKSCHPVVITGKEEIFPKLSRFHGLLNSIEDLKLFKRNLDLKVNFDQLRHCNIENFLQEHQDLQELTIECNAVESAFTFGFSCKDNISFLRMAAQNDDVSQMDLPKPFPAKCRSFSLLHHPSISILPNFENLKQIVLFGCLQLRNVDSLASIPCVTIHGCPNIARFSCFGASQRYLCLSGCVHLKDSDLEKFSNITWLSIACCESLQYVREGSLLNNRYLFLSFLKVKEIHLSGCSYVKVDIKSCSELSTLNITGQVQFLDLYYCDKLNPESIPRENYYVMDDYRCCYDVHYDDFA